MCFGRTCELHCVGTHIASGTLNQHMVTGTDRIQCMESRDSPCEGHRVAAVL
jgi:hypothetical protein